MVEKVWLFVSVEKLMGGKMVWLSGEKVWLFVSVETRKVSGGKMVWLSGEKVWLSGGGENDSSVNSLVKESRLLTFSELNAGNLEWTWTSLDQELDNLQLNIKVSSSFSSCFTQNIYLFSIWKTTSQVPTILLHVSHCGTYKHNSGHKL